MARQLRSLWRLADDAGFDSCWVVDHFASLGERDDGPIFETYGRLAAEAHAALVAYPARHGKHALQAAAA